MKRLTLIAILTVCLLFQSTYGYGQELLGKEVVTDEEVLPQPATVPDFRWWISAINDGTIAYPNPDREMKAVATAFMLLVYVRSGMNRDVFISTLREQGFAFTVSEGAIFDIDDDLPFNAKTLRFTPFVSILLCTDYDEPLEGYESENEVDTTTIRQAYLVIASPGAESRAEEAFLKIDIDMQPLDMEE